MTEKDRENRIKELIDTEFLTKLVEVGRLYGWNGDYCEIGGFIQELHTLKGLKIEQSDIEPYEIEYEQ